MAALAGGPGLPAALRVCRAGLLGATPLLWLALLGGALALAGASRARLPALGPLRLRRTALTLLRGRRALAALGRVSMTEAERAYQSDPSSAPNGQSR